MKKRMSRILSALLVSALVISSAEIAHAEEPAEPAGGEVQLVEETGSAESTEAVPEMKEEVQKISEPETRSTELMSMDQSMELMENGDVSWKKDQSFQKYETYYYGFSRPVSLTAGTVRIKAIHKSGKNSMYFGLYTDDSLSTRVATPEKTVSKGETETYAFKVPASGTYYIGIYSRISEADDVYSANVTYANLSGLDRAIGNNQNIVVGQIDEQTNYFTFKAPYTGYLQVIPVTQEALYNKVTLCNSGKKALTNALSMNYKPTYGVKAGITYCIGIRANSNYNGSYEFKVVNTPIKEKSGKTKKKAVTVKRNKTKKGTLLVGSKQADWYKFKLTKKKTVGLTIKGATNDRFKVTVYKGGKKIGTRTFWNSSASLALKSAGKWTKGTYYIKIQRGNSTSSGWYSLKWK